MKVASNAVILHLVAAAPFGMLGVHSATYPNNPDTDPPSQWSSMSAKFPDHCSPFGVSIFAKGWPRDKFLHACNVMAQFLDNDQDGCADDTLVVKKIRANQSGKKKTIQLLSNCMD